MCISNPDAQDNGVTMPELQLMRQLTAAKLNLWATMVGEGSCGGEISELIEGCEEVCFDPDGIADSGCIDDLADFNESEDTLEPFGDFISPGPADPTDKLLLCLHQVCKEID